MILNNNYKVENFMNTNKFKALFMGILIIATTFLVTSNNANGPTVFAQQQPSCPPSITVHISGLPGQTVDASTTIYLKDQPVGFGQINIPGIGSASIDLTPICP